MDYEKKQEICALRLEIEKANERIKVNVFLEKYQQNGHASLLVHNNEVKELSECYATLDVLEHESIFDKNLLIELNPNGKWLSWGGGSKDEKVTIPGESKLAVINISNDMGINDSLKFLFYGHEPETELTGCFNVIVRLHGKINNEEFEPVKFIGCIEFTKSFIGEDVITGLLIKNESCDQPAA